MSDATFRDLTTVERSILDRLLQDPFPGRDEISNQLNTCKVKPIDENGSLKFEVTAGKKASVKNRIPTEGEAKDRDGMPVFLLLHVVDGFVTELEIYRGDSAKVLGLPEAMAIKVSRA